MATMNRLPSATVHGARRALHTSTTACGGTVPLHEHVRSNIPKKHNRAQVTYPPTKKHGNRLNRGLPPHRTEPVWQSMRTDYVAPFERPRQAPPPPTTPEERRVKKGKSLVTANIISHTPRRTTDEQRVAPLGQRIPSQGRDRPVPVSPLLKYHNSMRLLRHKYTQELAVATQKEEQLAAKREGRTDLILPEGFDNQLLPPIHVEGIEDVYPKVVKGAEEVLQSEPEKRALPDGTIVRHRFNIPGYARASGWAVPHMRIRATAATILSRQGDPSKDATAFGLTPKGGDRVILPRSHTKKVRIANYEKIMDERREERVGHLIQLYQTAANFITLDNLDQKLDEFFEDDSEADGVSLEELLAAEEGSNKDYIPTKVIDRPRTLMGILDGSMGGKITAEALLDTAMNIKSTATADPQN